MDGYQSEDRRPLLEETGRQAGVLDVHGNTGSLLNMEAVAGQFNLQGQ
jgi:hypothetical protein